MKANMFQKSSLILASKSPRRKQLLEQVGLSFSVVPSTINELDISVTTPEQYVKILAEYKALDVSINYPDCWVIGADTIVVIDGEILGKPRSIMDARIMLNKLSGRIHHVMTGFCITCQSLHRTISDTICTEVQFKNLSPSEIEWYIKTNEPFDKAGAYAIQGIGTFLVKKIDGSYTNVVGLPVCEVLEILIQEGILNFNTILSGGC